MWRFPVRVRALASNTMGGIMRQGWDAYFIGAALHASERGTCSRAKVGAVIVKDRSMISTGYNGAPAGLPHCIEVGCQEYEVKNPDGEVDRYCFRTIHAEINAIAQAAKNGVSILGSTMYSTHSPCIHCCKVILNTGIFRIVYKNPYRLESIQPLIKEQTRVRLVQSE